MVNKFTSIKSRIRQIAELKGISYQELYKIIEMTDGSFKGDAILRPINSDAIVKLYTNFDDINLSWLLTGKGEPLTDINNYNLTEKDYKNISQQEQLDILFARQKELSNRLEKFILLMDAKEKMAIYSKKVKDEVGE